ncbi:hypothetical protein [Sphingobacterium multivorum]|uniref:hypothetical protein n=1 Tax=Sphingobacterium multivorum TaxID=28454 RepID=UPI0028A77B13|nr:hypothetical protein [Sphingobacterium multivorum]
MIKFDGSILTLIANGKELLFGDQAQYPVDQIKIYKIIMNDMGVPLKYSINREGKFIMIILDKVESSTFYIQLNSRALKINYNSKIDQKSPCKNYKLIDIKQNNLSGSYDGKNQVWILKK